MAGGGRSAVSQQQPADWPCDQVYNATIPLSTVWQGPDITPHIDTWWENTTLETPLAQLKELTLTEDQVQAIIDAFADDLSTQERTRHMLDLFAALYDTLSASYQRQLEGILKFAKKQKTFSSRISEAAAVVRELRKKGIALDDPQYEEAEYDLAWITRVFDEGQRLTPYICEEPIFLRQQLGFRARAIQKYLPQNP